MSFTLSPQVALAQHGSTPSPSMFPMLLGSTCSRTGQPKTGMLSTMKPIPGGSCALPMSPRLQPKSMTTPVASPRQIASPQPQSSPPTPGHPLASPRPTLGGVARFSHEQSRQARRHSDASLLRPQAPLQDYVSRPRRSSDTGLLGGPPQGNGWPATDPCRLLSSPQLPQTLCKGNMSDTLHVGKCLDLQRDPSLKSEILAKLGLTQSSRVETLSTNCGGCNQGVWIIQDPSSPTNLVVKLVRSQGQIGCSEAEKLRRLARKYPSIANDPAVAFPLKIFSCVDPSGSQSHDFIVMKKVAGEPVGDVIGIKWNSGQKAEAMKILRELGAFLAQFHKRYGNSQHGDFQPSNVFYDASSGKFAMIDIADLGDPSCCEGDVKHFAWSLRLLASAYGDQFYSEGTRNFEEGYKQGVQMPNSHA